MFFVRTTKIRRETVVQVGPILQFKILMKVDSFEFSTEGKNYIEFFEISFMLF
jgi:hypothetical protein